MTAYSRGHTNSTPTMGEGQKENRKKSNETKRKRTENNVQRVYGKCIHLETR